MSEEFPQVLNPSIWSEDAQKLMDRLLAKIIGQERAIEAFVRILQQVSVGMNRDGRPAAVFLFSGPTGVGKTALCQCVAEHLFGKREAITRIDCGEFQQSHEISKLIGSPPGYIGYNEKGAARLAQDKIDQWQTPENKHKLNLVLFDEIEEAHDALLSAILQILDAGRLTLGNGAETDFSKTIVILTSNLGEKEMQQVLTGASLGLRPESKSAEDKDEQIYRAGQTAAKKHFKAKFMNRVDKLIVFRSLSDTSLRKILKNELDGLEYRLWAGPLKLWESQGGKGEIPPFRPLLKFTEKAKDFIIKEGTSQVYGARELNRTIDRFVAFPLGALVGSKQIEHGDIIEADYKEGAKELVFSKIGKRDITPLSPASPLNGSDNPYNPLNSDFPKREPVPPKPVEVSEKPKKRLPPRKPMGWGGW